MSDGSLRNNMAFFNHRSMRFALSIALSFLVPLFAFAVTHAPILVAPVGVQKPVTTIALPAVRTLPLTYCFDTSSVFSREGSFIPIAELYVYEPMKTSTMLVEIVLTDLAGVVRSNNPVEKSTAWREFPPTLRKITFSNEFLVSAEDMPKIACIKFAVENRGSSVGTPVVDRVFLSFERNSCIHGDPPPVVHELIPHTFSVIDVAVRTSVRVGGDTVSSSGSKTTWEFTSTGAHSWIAPAGVTSVLVEAWGGGGGGGGGLNNAGGGGGGGYSKATVSVTPGQTYDVVVGAGGTSGSGAVSSFHTPSVVSALGGGSGLSTGGGAGGAASVGDGFSGGNGAAPGVVDMSGGGPGGGGGSSAGSAGAGNNGSGATGGTAPDDGGAGGDGAGGSGASGTAGEAPGGGGGGGGGNGGGGAGATGKVLITDDTGSNASVYDAFSSLMRSFSRWVSCLISRSSACVS